LIGSVKEVSMKVRVSVVMLAVLCLASLAVPSAGSAEVNFSIGVNVGPPAYVFHGPPPVVPIPRAYVYYVPDIAADVFYYRGLWYRPYEGGWYSARHYNGPWVYVYPKKVPTAFLSLPHGYRHHAAYAPIPYGQVKKQWRHWERERHWD
jgi:hypothetical protein